MSVYLNFVIPTTEEITHFLDQVKSRVILQLIYGISRVLQKLLRYFNGAVILISFALPSAGVFLVMLILYGMIQIVLYYHLDHLYNVVTNFLTFLNNYHCILLNYILASLYYILNIIYTTYTRLPLLQNYSLS